EDGHQADRAAADDHDRVAVCDAAADDRAVAGGKDVGEEDGRLVRDLVRKWAERTVGVRDADELGLASVEARIHARVPEERATLASQIAGSATSSTPTSPGARNTTAFKPAPRSRPDSRPGRHRRSGSRPRPAHMARRGNGRPRSPAGDAPSARRPPRRRGRRRPGTGREEPPWRRPADRAPDTPARPATGAYRRAPASHRADRRTSPRPRIPAGRDRTPATARRSRP